jgi:acyl carrier protein
MTREELQALFAEEIMRVAPDLGPDDITPEAHLQDDLSLDSMDIVALVAALHKRLGLAIPEADYGELATPARAAGYLERRLGDQDPAA